MTRERHDAQVEMGLDAGSDVRPCPRLGGKVALVTGAARGIGLAIAQRLAADGADVAINYRSSDPQVVGNAIVSVECAGARADAGVVTKTRAYRADVSDHEEVGRMFEQAMSEFGRLDIMVANSGITRDDLAVRMETQSFMDVIETNLLGAFICAKEAARAMLRQRSGRIVFVSSIAGLDGNAGQSNYAASKAGLVGLAKSLARELGSRGITVNVVAPGFIDTDMTRALPDEMRDSCIARAALRRVGLPQEVADAVAFFASEEARYITGQVLRVDGGLTL
ncbi:MAG: 3-oxoacyl-[acyl-carrier-protein] reductase [Firmicutes bacterium]|jgi:3-oxoacyl-[acyl-carrier protein] reductase|nr:3-oxoacyl-[acyl-carrier-protein] reductase [Bacillota bacterium]MDD4793070.1 3-oxoacyl-[acyl-carrier-protein] reductase [Bacillota bacterium]